MGEASDTDTSVEVESKRIEEFYEEKMFCHHCDDSLAGHRYVLRDDHPYCIKCYENVFANNCDECGKIIGIDSKLTKLHFYFKTSTVVHCFCQEGFLHPSITPTPC